ncbi:MAG: hypothetical protein NWQ31_08380 [Polaribacter sp.]|nr:hypothetical protein [Polaribacter sp.]
MKKKIIAIIGLLLCLLGVCIQIFENGEQNFIPDSLKGTGLYLLILGASFSYFYSLSGKEKKEK